MNTEKDTRQLKSGKEKNYMEMLEKDSSWAPATQSHALYLVDEAAS